MTHDWTRLPGRLVVVSGPSGCGKSTILRRALDDPTVSARLSVSATSRPPRQGEEGGLHYEFVSRGQFEAARDRGQFLEWAEVHGNLYGTPIAPVIRSLEAGECVVLEIDVQGAAQVTRAVPTADTIFVTVPSLDVLEARLRGRGTEPEAVVRRRLDNARRELESIHLYTHTIVNDDLDRAVSEMVALLVGAGCKGADRDA
ncbi:guanylate kinase [Tautonia plasticadhaerens]|uniref:Guanylate kinase n=1 Tax=Tautonia plasticadhaerens TaxID=2527974 RepID=A0A518GVA5_9BACT|nr:guanylate kinase [Tautonia plasticadhaerens]QDV32504.1 Guanylate kinase [Tautonia plasticadhaerens]